MKTNTIQIYESENAMTNADLEKNQKIKESIENKKNSGSMNIILIIIGIGIIIGVVITLFFVLKKNKKEEEEQEEEEDEIDYFEKDENNCITTTMNDDFEIPSNKKIQVVGVNFQHKNVTFIVGKKNKTFIIYLKK